MVLDVLLKYIIVEIEHIMCAKTARQTTSSLTFTPSLQNLLIQLSHITLILGLDGCTRQDALGRQVTLTILIPPEFH